MTSSSDTEIFTAKNVFPYTDTIHQWDSLYVKPVTEMQDQKQEFAQQT